MRLQVRGGGRQEGFGSGSCRLWESGTSSWGPGSSSWGVAGWTQWWHLAGMTTMWAPRCPLLTDLREPPRMRVRGLRGRLGFRPLEVTPDRDHPEGISCRGGGETGHPEGGYLGEQQGACGTSGGS